MRHFIPCRTTIDAIELAKLFLGRLCSCMAGQRLLFRIGDLSLLLCFRDRYAAGWELSDECLQHFTPRRTVRPNGWMQVSNNTSGCLLIINRMIGYSGYPLLNLLQIMAYLSERSIPCSLQFRVWIPGCHWQKRQHRNGTNDHWMRTKFKLRCNRFTNICGLRWDWAKSCRKKERIEDAYLHPIYKLDLRFDWMLAMSEQLDQPGNWIGNDWDLSRCVGKYPCTHMSWSCLRQYKFIEFNPFRFWIW